MRFEVGGGLQVPEAVEACFGPDPVKVDLEHVAYPAQVAQLAAQVREAAAASRGGDTVGAPGRGLSDRCQGSREAPGSSGKMRMRFAARASEVIPASALCPAVGVVGEFFLVYGSEPGAATYCWWRWFKPRRSCSVPYLCTPGHDNPGTFTADVVATAPDRKPRILRQIPNNLPKINEITT